MLACAYRISSRSTLQHFVQRRRRRAHSGNRKKPSSKPCQASSKSHSPLKGGSPVLIFTVCRAHPRVKRRRAAARRRLVVRFLQLRQTEPEREPGHVQRRRGASAGPDLGRTWQQRSSFATVHAAVVCSRPRRWQGCRKINHTRMFLPSRAGGWRT